MGVKTGFMLVLFPDLLRCRKSEHLDNDNEVVLEKTCFFRETEGGGANMCRKLGSFDHNNLAKDRITNL